VSTSRRRAKKNICNAFSKAVNSYDAVAGLQRKVGKALLTHYNRNNLTGTLLDIGCGTGFLTGELLALSAEDSSLIALDLALSMVEATRLKYIAQKNLYYLCADVEAIPLPANSIDWVFSNLVLQWCENLSIAFNEIQRILKPQGRLVFSTFGTQTLQELKMAWAGVDYFTHVNSFYSATQLYHALEIAGYQNIMVTETLHQTHYDSVIALMRELKSLGAHHVIAGGNQKMTGKEKMQAMIQKYEQLRVDYGIPATFQMINVYAQVK
jgi:malonyl-CoA O-methyltransferase